MQFLDPTNPSPSRYLRVATVNELKGTRLAYLNNGWISMAKIGKRIEGQLKARHGVSELVYYDVPRNMEPAGGLLDRVAGECDAAIVGMAN